MKAFIWRHFGRHNNIGIFISKLRHMGCGNRSFVLAEVFETLFVLVGVSTYYMICFLCFYSLSAGQIRYLYYFLIEWENKLMIK